MDKRFDRVEKAIGELKGYFIRLVWLVIVPVIGGLVSLVVANGSISLG
jgi:hypothetical protein